MSIDRYVVNGDGLQVDSNGFLVRFYDYEQLRAEVERLTRERDEARAQADGLAEALRRCIGSLGAASSAGPDHPDVEFARAALAVLPKEDDDA